MKLLFKNKSEVINGDQIIRFWIRKTEGDSKKYILNADLAGRDYAGIPQCEYLGTYSTEENAQRAIYLLAETWQHQDIAYIIPDEHFNTGLIIEDLKNNGII